VALSDLVAKDVSGPHVVLKHGGGGPETDLICGAFDFRRPYGTTLLGSLPEWLHIRASETAEWVESTIRLLSAETRRADEGTGAVIARLTEILFVQAVRAWLRGRPDAATGWLGALREPAIGRALQLIHQMPERAWTVASLAAEVGMSRSPFASRFTALVGTSPLAYLARWRMHVAADLLEGSTMSMSEIAERVGYASEAAFGRGFKKEFGVSPGAFRRMRV
jgi:AraC-like DNA-binding protein